MNSRIQYLDDFLCMGPADSRICAVLMATLEHIADKFGIPLAADKTEGPCTVITFLGIVLDTEAMECRLPDDKLEDLKSEIAGIMGLRKVQLRTLQLVLGKLNFACRILPMRRVFCRRLSASTSGVKSPKTFCAVERNT